MSQERLAQNSAYRLPWASRIYMSTPPSEDNIYNAYETGEYCGGMRDARFEVWTKATDQKQGQ